MNVIQIINGKDTTQVMQYIIITDFFLLIWLLLFLFIWLLFYSCYL